MKFLERLFPVPQARFHTGYSRQSSGDTTKSLEKNRQRAQHTVEIVGRKEDTSRDRGACSSFSSASTNRNRAPT